MLNYLIILFQLPVKVIALLVQLFLTLCSHYAITPGAALILICTLVALVLADLFTRKFRQA